MSGASVCDAPLTLVDRGVPPAGQSGRRPGGDADRRD